MVRYRIRVPEKYKTALDKSAESDPVRIVVLSDMHDHAGGRAGRRIEQTIAALHPQMIFCSGDMATAKNGICHFETSLKLLETLAEKYPVFAVDGNHEERMKQARAGVKTEKYE